MSKHTQTREAITKLPSHVFCGFTTGLIQAVLFNPYDRALYLSIEKQRPFMSMGNWRINGADAMKGVWPSILQRAVSFGFYFPLESFSQSVLSSSALSAGQTHALSGLIAGAMNGLITSPINATKYAVWRETNHPTSRHAFEHVYKRGGIRGLLRAAPATIGRDTTFGIVFSYLRHRSDHSGLVENAAAGLIATAASSPFNYARLKQYSIIDGPGVQTPTTLHVWRDLANETISKHSTFVDRGVYVFKTLNVGWGALRVALGMGIGSQLYRLCTAQDCFEPVNCMYPFMDASCQTLTKFTSVYVADLFENADFDVITNIQWFRLAFPGYQSRSNLGHLIAEDPHNTKTVLWAQHLNNHRFIRPCLYKHFGMFRDGDLTRFTNFAGCKDAKIDVEALGKELPALKMVDVTSLQKDVEACLAMVAKSMHLEDIPVVANKCFFAQGIAAYSPNNLNTIDSKATLPVICPLTVLSKKESQKPVCVFAFATRPEDRGCKWFEGDSLLSETMSSLIGSCSDMVFSVTNGGFKVHWRELRGSHDPSRFESYDYFKYPAGDNLAAFADMSKFAVVLSGVCSLSNL